MRYARYLFVVMPKKNIIFVIRCIFTPTRVWVNFIKIRVVGCTGSAPFILFSSHMYRSRIYAFPYFDLEYWNSSNFFFPFLKGFPRMLPRWRRAASHLSALASQQNRLGGCLFDRSYAKVATTTASSSSPTSASKRVPSSPEVWAKTMVLAVW